MGVDNLRVSATIARYNYIREKLKKHDLSQRDYLLFYQTFDCGFIDGYKQAIKDLEALNDETSVFIDDADIY